MHCTLYIATIASYVPTPFIIATTEWLELSTTPSDHNLHRGSESCAGEPVETWSTA